MKKVLVVVVAFLLTLTVAVSPAQAAPTAGDESMADVTAGWVARTLESNNGLAVSPQGGIDYATTAYALLGLRAAGVAGLQIKASAAAMAATKDDFIGDPSQVGAKTTAIALMILALASANLNPSQYAGATGERNLFADLKSAVQADGAIGDTPTTYGQALAILALLSAGNSYPVSSIQWLQAQICTDQSSPGYGGFSLNGSGSCTDTDPDSTALAVLALLAALVSPAKLQAEKTYLLSQEDPAGGFTSPFSGVNANTTGLAMSALAGLGVTQSDLGQSAGYLQSLMVTCMDLSQGAATADVGALAYDTQTRASLQFPSTPTSSAALFQATAQGLWGLVAQITAPTNLFALSDAVPAMPECSTATPSVSASPLPGSPAPGVVSAPTPVVAASSISPLSGWVWAGAGVLVIVLILIVWRVVASRKQ